MLKKGGLKMESFNQGFQREGDLFSSSQVFKFASFQVLKLSDFQVFMFPEVFSNLPQIHR